MDADADGLPLLQRRLRVDLLKRTGMSTDEAERQADMPAATRQRID